MDEQLTEIEPIFQSTDSVEEKLPDSFALGQIPRSVLRLDGRNGGACWQAILGMGFKRLRSPFACR